MLLHKPVVFFVFACIGLLAVGLLLMYALTCSIYRTSIPPTCRFCPWLSSSDTRAEKERFLDKEGNPRPIFVVAGGAPRTGSTFIFNVLRILMRVRDPNTVASSSWMLAKLIPENRTVQEYDRIQLLRTLGTSFLVKVHTAKQYYEFAGPLHVKKFADEVDLLVTGHRDLREETMSALKMFVKNKTEWAKESTWTNMCRALIRRRDSLIKEAGDRVPVLDLRYEDWRTKGEEGRWELVKQLADMLPWVYPEEELRRVLQELQEIRVPTGGPAGKRVEWHVQNLMSPKHISAEHLAEDLVHMGVNAVFNEPTCSQWLMEKQYV